MKTLQETMRQISDSIQGWFSGHTGASGPSCFDRPLKVLCILREGQETDLTRRILEPKGCQVVTVADGVRGLGMVRSEQPDVVILDELTPGMNGYKVYTAIKADEHVCRIPLVFIQARSTPRWPGAPASQDVIPSTFASGALIRAVEWVMAHKPEDAPAGPIPFSTRNQDGL